MTEADSLVFAAEMALLAEIYEKQLSPTLVRAYFEALEGYGLDEVRRAMRSSIRTNLYFPRPVVVIEAIREGKRMLKASPALALMPPRQITPEEQVEIDAARAQFRAVVSVDVFRQFSPGSMPEVGPEQAAAHEARKREALEKFNGAAAR